jgi:hypothetical protein
MKELLLSVKDKVSKKSWRFICRLKHKLAIDFWAFLFKYGYNFVPKAGYPYKPRAFTLLGLDYKEDERDLFFTIGSFRNMDEKTGAIKVLSDDQLETFYRKRYTIDSLDLPKDIAFTDFEKISAPLLAYFIRDTQSTFFSYGTSGGSLYIKTNSLYAAARIRYALSLFQTKFGVAFTREQFFTIANIKAADHMGIVYAFNHLNGNLFIEYDKDFSVRKYSDNSHHFTILSSS